MKILLIDTVHPVLIEMLESKGFQCVIAADKSKGEIELILPDFDGIIIRSRFKLDQDFIAKGTNLKFIARPGAGLENIDVSYAESKGISCLRSPEGNRDAVAEHCLAMLLALFNNIKRADEEMRKDVWNRVSNWGTELKGKTIGILGYGFMGEAFAQRLSGFSVKVLVVDKYKKDFLKDSNYMKESTLEELFKQCDVLSLHLPLTQETKGMVNAEFLARFENSIYLINSARGGIVSLNDLAESIKSGKVLGACLDVFEFEEVNFEGASKSIPEGMNYLKSSDKVLLSPHIAGWTHESNRKIASVLAEKIIAQFGG